MLQLLTGPFWKYASIGLFALLTLQTARIEGFLFIDGFKDTIAEQEASIAQLEDQIEEEREAHRKTKDNYRAAQELAQAENIRHVAEIEATQQEVTNNVANSYRARIADLQRRVFDNQQARATAQGSSDPAGVSRIPNSTDGADGAPGYLTFDERLVCIEQGIQLDELINWVESQKQ